MSNTLQDRVRVGGLIVEKIAAPTFYRPGVESTSLCAEGGNSAERTTPAEKEDG